MVQVVWKEIGDDRWLQIRCITLWGARRLLRKMGFVNEGLSTLDRAPLETYFCEKQLGLDDKPRPMARAFLRRGTGGGYVISVWMLNPDDGSTMTKTQLKHQERFAEKLGLA